MSETTDPAPPPAAAPAEPSSTPVARVRLTSVAGALAAACLCGSFFLLWVRVPADMAADFQHTMEREATAREPASQGAQDFLAIAEDMRTHGGLRGIDIIHWVRAGQVVGAELDEAANPGVGPSEHERRLTLARVLLLGMPLAAFLLAAHFLVHRFRRARSPVLILAILTGLSAFVTAFLFDFSQRFRAGLSRTVAEPLVGEWELGGGWVCLLAGGALLTLAGLFGVRAGNWFRVYVISGATALALGLLAVRYYQTGAVP